MKFKNETVQKHQELADKIKENFEVSASSIKEKEAHSSYYGNLPEGVDRKTVDELSKYNSKFVTAAHVAVAETAAEIFKKDKSTDKVYATLGFFGPNDSIDIQVDRTKTFTNHLAKNEDDKEVVKHLHMNTNVTIKSAKGMSIKAVKDAIGDEFKNSFNK